MISQDLVNLESNPGGNPGIGDGDGDLDDATDRPVISSYTFPVRSTAAFGATTILTVTFPTGYDLTAAKRDLGYVPEVTMEEGMRRLAKSLN